MDRNSGRSSMFPEPGSPEVPVVYPAPGTRYHSRKEPLASIPTFVRVCGGDETVVSLFRPDAGDFARYAGLPMETSTIRYRVADFLKQHPPFNAMDDADLVALAENGRVRFYEANEFILWQGEPHGDSFPSLM